MPDLGNVGVMWWNIDLVKDVSLGLDSLGQDVTRLSKHLDTTCIQAQGTMTLGSPCKCSN